MTSASSCYASPLCDWLVTACMSAGGERLALSDTHSYRRRRLLLQRCSAVSAHGSSSIQMQSILSSCNHNALSSLFQSDDAYLNRKQRRLNRASTSGQVTLEMDKEAMVNKKPFVEPRRVVVTGMEVETPLGHDPHTFYDNLLQGITSISQIEDFYSSAFPTRIAGEIKTFSTEGWVAPKLSKRMDIFMLYLLIAGKKALADGGVTEHVMAEFGKSRCRVLIGSAMGGMKGWMGPNYSISTACATDNFCILNAANHIIRGDADVMLCGGSDSVILPIGLGGFVACLALSQQNDDPTKASRPWDSNWDGFVMGEGAGVLLLEELKHAKKRGATIYAEFLGGSFTCDAYHITEPRPDGAGVILCIEKALARAGISKEDINYVNAHATSTPAGDLKKYQALAHCFGQNPEVKIHSTKSMIGHLLGASGAVEAVAIQLMASSLDTSLCLQERINAVQKN